MKRTLAIYSLLLVLVLGLSYMSWTQPPSAGKEDVMVFHADAEQITSIHWVSKKLDLTITRKEDDLGPYFWATGESVQYQQGQNGEETGESTTELFAFKTGKKAEGLFGGFAPLIATREFKDVSQEKLEEYGFAEPGTLTITREGQRDAEFEVGRISGGIKFRYIRDSGSGTIYLIREVIVEPLRDGFRLTDKLLWASGLSDSVKIELSQGDHKLTLEQRNREDPRAAFWAVPGQENAHEMATVWLRKLARPNVKKYILEGQDPALTLDFTVISYSEQGEVERLELLRGTSEHGEELWYGRSTHTRGSLVLLNQKTTPQVAADVPALLGGAPTGLGSVHPEPS